MKTTLKRARLSQGFCQEEAAKRLNISRSTLSRYEKGKAFPKIHCIKKMEELYQVSYNNIQFII